MFIKFHHIKHTGRIIILIIILALGGWAWVETSYANVALPGVKILGLSVSGKNRDQIIDLLNRQYDEATRDGVRVVYKNRVATLYPEVVAANDPDLFYQLFRVNVEQTADNLIAFGHTKNPLVDIPEIIGTATIGVRQPLSFTVFENAFITTLRENFGDLEHPAENPHPIYRNGQIAIGPGKTGVSFNFAAATDELRSQIAQLQFATISLALMGDEPKVTVAEVAPLAPRIKKLSDQLPVTLQFDGREWPVSRDMFLHWLDFSPDTDGIKLTLNPNELFTFFTGLRKIIDQKPVDAKFKMQNHKVIEFQGSRAGRMLDYDKTATALTALLLSDVKPSDSSLSIATITIDPHTTTDNVNNLGIKELIGVGVSDFKGSPPNRIHNIQTGAAAVNGTLIAPDETFSLLKLIGNVDEENGYLPELVIKGNKTTKEFGGGLCQIGTTMFRGTLASGLPILERQNHSYRVSYYEPAGTDATIYDPSPDYKFKNDTGHYILLQSKIKGTQLNFEFWGTNDGRTALQTSSTVYNIVKPDEPLISPTETLPVGVQKCSEHAHDGADAKFSYTVTYADNRIVTKEFKSHYKPWREVCLIGVPKGTLAPGTDPGLAPTADAAGANAH